MLDQNLTHLLRRLPEGGRDAFDDLLAEAFPELRHMARGQIRRERREHTLSATGLVHEGWLRLVNQRHPRFENRAHFFGAAAQAMRRVLVDHARSRAAGKRYNERVGLTAADSVAETTPPLLELLAVD